MGCGVWGVGGLLGGLLGVLEKMGYGLRNSGWATGNWVLAEGYNRIHTRSGAVSGRWRRADFVLINIKRIPSYLIRQSYTDKPHIPRYTSILRAPSLLRTVASTYPLRLALHTERDAPQREQHPDAGVCT